MPIRIIFAIQTRSNSNEMISIQPVLHNKKQYLDLLLLADEQESMIDRYLERGEMFVLSEDGSIRASCVVTREAEDVFEIKNIAVYPQFQRRGYGKKLIQYLFGHYAGRCRTTRTFHRVPDNGLSWILVHRPKAAGRGIV